MMSPFRTKEGKIVIAQTPNLPLIVWFVAKVATYLPLPPVLVQPVEMLAFGAIFTWAWMELFDGVNLFRRVLGAVVLVFLVV